MLGVLGVLGEGFNVQRFLKLFLNHLIAPEALGLMMGSMISISDLSRIFILTTYSNHG